MIEFVDVCKQFGNVTALSSVSLALKAGELLAMLGPSGCGKTTLLRIAGGYEPLDTGRILVDGRDATYVNPERRNIGMVFQNYALFPHMTVLQNVEFGLRMRRIAKQMRRIQALQMLSFTGLVGVENRRPHELSGGQQQRVALARALVIEPSVLLLDEPLANLDRNVRLRMREELRSLQRRLGITTILVTHDQEEALAIADRIALMNEGRIEQVGSSLDFYLHPANGFVSSFFGLESGILE